jgi:predicted TIM-barrel fold metal-dependent hydrolase
MRGPVFDFHARLRPDPDAARTLLVAMDAAGVVRAAVSAGGLVDLDRLSAQLLDGGRADAVPDNDGVLRACDASGGRLVPVYFADPSADPAIYRRAAPRFHGLELSPAVHGFRLDDPAVTAHVEAAGAAGRPVYVACVGRRGARPADLADLAGRFPSVRFVLGHCGATALDADGLRRVAPHENVLAETSGCLTAIARLALRRLGPHRVLFGSEYPLQHHDVELVKVAALGLGQADWCAVTWRNAHRLLGLEESWHGG